MKLWRNCLNFLKGLIGSKKCLACPNINQEVGNLCPECWSKLNFIESLDDEIFVLHYNKLAGKLVWKYKFDRDFAYLPIISNLMAFYLQKQRLEFDYIIPVPLTNKKLKKRGFNQAGFLAKRLAKKTNSKLGLNFLFKIKETGEQKNLDLKSRKENLKGAFEVRNIDLIADKKILLIDDVATSKSTLIECKKTLSNAGAGQIYLFSFAKSF